MKVHFGRLQPIYNQEKLSLIYASDSDVLSFNFQENNVETKIENVLCIITYLHETVCMDGMHIILLLNRHPTQINYNLKAALPILPNEAVHS